MTANASESKPLPGYVDLLKGGGRATNCPLS